MVCFREVETKQVQNANDQVKLARNSQVKSKIGYDIANQFECVGHIRRRDHNVVIDITIQDELDHPPGQSIADLADKSGVVPRCNMSYGRCCNLQRGRKERRRLATGRSMKGYWGASVLPYHA